MKEEVKEFDKLKEIEKADIKAKEIEDELVADYMKFSDMKAFNHFMDFLKLQRDSYKDLAVSLDQVEMRNNSRDKYIAYTEVINTIESHIQNKPININ